MYLKSEVYYIVITELVHITRVNQLQTHFFVRKCVTIETEHQYKARQTHHTPASMIGSQTNLVFWN